MHGDAGRGITMHGNLAFRRSSGLGSAQACELFDLIKGSRRDPERPAERFDDYVVGDCGWNPVPNVTLNNWLRG